MKRKKAVIVMLLLLFLIAVIGVGLFFREQRIKQLEKDLKIYYSQQNKTLPQKSTDGYEYRPLSKEITYRGYDTIDEPELYVNLTVYNECIDLYEEDTPKLTLKDIEDYLSSEYNEDGSLRIYDSRRNMRYANDPEIGAYVDWYLCGGRYDIAEYWIELDRIEGDYQRQNPEIILPPLRDMSIIQLQELINKRNDPSYEINPEVMKGVII